jgi:hypothetical protein
VADKKTPAPQRAGTANEQPRAPREICVRSEALALANSLRCVEDCDDETRELAGMLAIVLEARWLDAGKRLLERSPRDFAKVMEMLRASDESE